MELTRSRRAHAVRHFGSSGRSAVAGYFPEHASARGVVDFFDLSLEAQIDRLSDAIGATSKDIDAWVARVATEAEKRAGNPAFPECKSGDADVAFRTHCLTDSERAGDAFINDSWNPFLKRWRTYVGEGDWFDTKAAKAKWTAADNEAFNNDLENLRAKFKTVTGAELPTDLPTKKPEDKGGAGDSLGRLSDSLGNVVKIAGIGMAAYIVLNFVAPTMFGAAQKTREAKRAYAESK